MEPILTDDLRASSAFIEALRRTEDMDFSKDEIKISHKKKIRTNVCTLRPKKEGIHACHRTSIHISIDCSVSKVSGRHL